MGDARPTNLVATVFFLMAFLLIMPVVLSPPARASPTPVSLGRQPPLMARVVSAEAVPSSINQAPAAATAAGTTAWTELGPKPIVAPSGVPGYYGTAPFSGRVTAISVNGSNLQNLYVGGAQGGVWKSTDGGNTWTPLTDSQASLAVGSIVISPDRKTIYVGTGEPNHSGDAFSGAGLLKSTDGGRTWTLLGASIFKGSSIADVLINSANPGRILVSTTRGDCCKGFYIDSNESAFGVYLSTDGGNTWNPTLVSHDTKVSFTDLVANSTNPNTVYASGFNGTVWRSTNGGSSWSIFLHLTTDCLTGSGCRTEIASTPARPGSLFVAFAKTDGNLYGIYRDDVATSNVVGLSMPPVPPNTVDPCNNQCDYDMLLAADPSDANVLYFGGVDLFVSTDGGTTWTDLGGFSSGSIHPDQHALAFLPTSPSTIFVGNDGGIWKSTDRGSTWVDLNSGLGLTQFYSIAGDPSTFLIGGSQDNGCLKYTGSSSWQEIEGGDGGWSGVESSNPSTLYCNYINLNFYKSTDGGSTFQKASDGINLNDASEFIAPAAQDPSTPGTIYIGGTQVYKTTNFATTWTDVSGPLGGSVISALAVAPSSSGTVYLGDEAGDVKVSTDGGHSWQLVGTITGYAIAGIAVDPTNPDSVYVAAAFQNTLHRFVLQSGSWQQYALSPAPDRIDVVRMNKAGTLYIGTDHGAYYSTDSGSTWASPGNGLPKVAVYDIEVTSTNQVIAATHGRGVWIVTPTPPTVTSLTLSYSVNGGGAGYSPPSLTYVSGGVSQSAVLGTSPTTYILDPGSAWSVSNGLAGSSASERWQTDQTTAGVISSSQTIDFAYYHQFSTAYGFDVVGGGSGYGVPLVTLVQFGVAASAPAGSVVWSDASSSYSYPAQLTGSSGSERWATTGQGGTVSAPGAVTVSFYHQYLLDFGYSVVGAGSPSSPTLAETAFGSRLVLQLSPAPTGTWVDSGTAYSASNPLAGSTPVERWYSLVANGTASGPGTVIVDYHHQYALTGASTTTAKEWFDEGTQVTISAPTTLGRTNGTGFRVASATIDGGQPQVFPLTMETVPISVMMNGPHTIAFNEVRQFQVSLDSGASRALGSITAATIPGDRYWYDAGTPVSVMLNGEWGRSSGSGMRLSAYSTDGGPQTMTDTTGALTVPLGAISAPQSVSAVDVTQYLLSAGTGSIASVTPPAVSGDADWYDAGTIVTLSYEGAWNIVAQQSRLAATSYIVDGGSTTPVPEPGNGTFSLTVTMNAAHTVHVNSVTQYYISFKFADASGANAISTSELQISVSGQNRSVPGFSTFLERGTVFTISRVGYEGLDVKPVSSTQYSVSGPAVITVEDRVYDAAVKVTDVLGLAVSNAQVRMTLANGTTISGTTDAEGTFVAQNIPLGSFTASVSSLGSTSQVAGDASRQSVTAAQVLFGGVSLAIVVVSVLVAVGAAFFLLRRSKGGSSSA